MAIAFGLVLEKLNMPDLEWNVAVGAWNTILYAIFMLIADMLKPRNNGSLADILTNPHHVRFTPNNGRWVAHPSQHLAVGL